MDCLGKMKEEYPLPSDSALLAALLASDLAPPLLSLASLRYETAQLADQRVLNARHTCLMKAILQCQPSEWPHLVIFIMLLRRQ